MIYKIGNSSDACTIESDCEAAACLAAMFLGNGWYPLSNERNEQVCPVFIGGGSDEWFQEHHGMTIAAALDSYKPNVAEALASFLYGTPDDRAEFKSAVKGMTDEDAKAFADKWSDSKRTSMNDIGKRAAGLVAHLSMVLP